MYHNSKKNLTENQFDPTRRIHKSYEGIAITKVYLENICKFFSERSSTIFTVLRHSNLYGSYDKFNSKKSHFLAALISKLYNDKILKIWGNGNERRDFLYIEDFLKGLNLILQKQKSKYKLYNMSYGKTFAIKEIVELVLKISKLNKNILFEKNKPTINIQISVSSNKLFNEIGWKPTHTIENGLRKTLKWYKDNY